MSIHQSDSVLRVLHAVRTLGYADVERLAARAHLRAHEVDEHLLDSQAHGLVTWTSFGGDSGWSLTEAGKAHGERLVAAELDEAGARDAVVAAHHDFLTVNDLVSGACTRWQLAELGIGDEAVTLDDTLDALRQAAITLAEIEMRLANHLSRFCGYHARFAAALHSTRDDHAWIAGTDRDSAHKVWFELHEDLIATLGLKR